MDKAALQEALAEQRRRTLDVLDGLTDEQWNSQSLCTDWRVRDVLGHLVSVLDIPVYRVWLRGAKARNGDKALFELGREYGSMDRQELMEKYRYLGLEIFASSPPFPFAGGVGPLGDLQVHTRDIERPLGIPSTLHTEGLRTVIDRNSQNLGFRNIVARHIRGLRLEASDMDWSIGKGPTVRGTAEAILMMINARPASLPDLESDGDELLEQRLG